jgi:hypothetical protein
MLLTAMNGPIGAAYSVADDLDWAHFSYLQLLPMATNGPIGAAYSAADDLYWAH